MQEANTYHLYSAAMTATKVLQFKARQQSFFRSSSEPIIHHICYITASRHCAAAGAEAAADFHKCCKWNSSPQLPPDVCFDRTARLQGTRSLSLLSLPAPSIILCTLALQPQLPHHRDTLRRPMPPPCQWPALALARLDCTRHRRRRRHRCCRRHRERNARCLIRRTKQAGGRRVGRAGCRRPGLLSLGKMAAAVLRHDAVLPVQRVAADV